MAAGEFALIGRHFTRETRDPSVSVPIGDDAAVVDLAPGMELVLAVDMMVEGRHFLAGADAGSLGHKVLAVNLSDIAAMGARPRWALLAGALPDADDAWLAAFTRGLFALADAHGVSLIGGDTTRGPRTLSLTIAGEVPRGEAITRGGAQPDDDVWVSGTLGDAMLGLAAIEGRFDVAGDELAGLRARLDRPTPRVALGQALRGIASAMIDVSDGVTGDLGHILEMSGVGATVDIDALPRSAVLDRCLAGAARETALACLLSGGDDYELCFTAPIARRDEVVRAAGAAGVTVARVGAITSGSALVLRDASGATLPVPRSFDHFA